MKVGVLGLWHLGGVTASALASLGHHVNGVDPNELVVKNLSKGIPPLFEPGLEKLIQTGLQSNSLVFTNDYAQGVLWAKTAG
jgi:UDPglucose 6-dehydrogenase